MDCFFDIARGGGIKEALQKCVDIIEEEAQR
jgi:hypothetical protein